MKAISSVEIVNGYTRIYYDDGSYRDIGKATQNAGISEEEVKELIVASNLYDNIDTYTNTTAQQIWTAFNNEIAMKGKFAVEIELPAFTQSTGLYIALIRPVGTSNIYASGSTSLRKAIFYIDTDADIMYSTAFCTDDGNNVGITTVPWSALKLRDGIKGIRLVAYSGDNLIPINSKIIVRYPSTNR